jgi:8-oxo-dGTP pyrophosphatase MutT (NUDIX family)
MGETEHFKIHGAVFLIPRRKNEILLLRRYNTGWHDGEYSLVSGHIDGQESFTAALCREAREEAGITIAPKDVRCVHVMNRHDTDDHKEYVDMYFEASTWEGEITNMEPGKCDDLRWFPTGALPRNVVPAVRYALEQCRDGVSYSEYGWK